MENSNKTPTVFDVARLAGVSRGTVDRVLHSRGRVSQETVKKVQDAVEQLRFSPNPNAASLGSKRSMYFPASFQSLRMGTTGERFTRDLWKGSRIS